MVKGVNPGHRPDTNQLKRMPSLENCMKYPKYDIIGIRFVSEILYAVLYKKILIGVYSSYDR